MRMSLSCHGVLLLGVASSASFAQVESGLPVLLGQPNVEPPRFEGRTDASAFPQWWYLHHETLLDLRRTVTGGVDATHGFRRVLDSDFERVMIALEAAQADSNPGVRAAAALALAKSRDRRGIAALLSEPQSGIPAPIFDSNGAVRRAAILGLGVGGDSAALVTLREIVGDPKWETELRTTAAIALGLLEVKVVTGEAVEAEPGAAAPTLRLEPSGALQLGVASGATALALDAAAERALLGFEDGKLALWPTKASKLGKTWPAHKGRVTGIVRLPDPDRFATAGIDGTLRVHSLKLAKEVVRLDGLGEIVGLAIEAKGERIAVCATSGEVVLAPVSGRKDFVVRRPAHRGPANAVAFCGPIAYSAGDDGMIYAHEANPELAPRAVASLGEPLRALAASGDGKFIAVVTAAGVVRCIAAGSGDAAWTRDLGAAAHSVRSDPEGRWFAIALDGGAVHLLACADGAAAGSAEVRGRALDFGAVGDFVAIAGEDGAITRFQLVAAPAAAPAVPGGGSPAIDPAFRSKRSSHLAELLALDVFVGLDPMIQDGVALGAALAGDPDLAPAVLAILEKGERKGISAPSLGYLALAFGRLVAAGAKDVAALAKFAFKSDSADVRRAAVLGLGAALENRSGEAESIVNTMLNRLTLSSGEPDRRVKNALSLALGRIGGSRAEHFLLDELSSAESGGSGLVRTPPALGVDELDRAPLQAVALASMKSASGYKLTQRRYGKEGAIHFRGALAIALGIHGPASAGANKELKADLAKEKNPVLLAHLALGLGLARANGALSNLEDLLRDPKTDATILPQIAIARALLDVPGAVVTPGLLATRLAAARTNPERAALAFALGLVGDATSVEPLLGLLHAKECAPDVRAAVVSALGELLDPGAHRRLGEALALLDGIEDPRLIAIFAQ